MSKHQSSTDASQGSPNLEILQYLQENWGPTQIASALRVAKAEVVPSGGNIEVDIPVGAEILDVVVICTKANGSGTVTLETNADTPVAITDAIACVTDKAVARAGTIDDAYNVVTEDGVIAVPHAVGDSGDVFVIYKK